MSPVHPEDLAVNQARLEEKLDGVKSDVRELKDVLEKRLEPLEGLVDSLDAFRNRVMGAVLVLGSGGALGLAIRYFVQHP